MEMCRACLTTDEELIKLDATSIQSYNFLTNISVQMMDSLPQCMCSSCSVAIKFYATFRSKCIESEASLQQILLEKKVKFENKGVLDEQEVKLEIDYSNDYQDDYEDDYGYDFDNMEMKVKMDVDRDLEPKAIKNKTGPKKKPVTPKKTVKKTGRNTIKKTQNKPNVKKKKIEIYSCGLCPKTFNTTISFTEHVERHKKPKLLCEICKDKFETWEPFLAHRFRHLEPEQLMCHLCFRKFGLSVAFQNHFLIDHSKKVTEFRCAWCDARVKSRRALNKHVLIHADRQYICDYCQQTFTSKHRLSVHITRHMSVKRFKCQLCEKRFKYISGLTLHKRKFHTEGEFCSNCTKVFPDRGALESHCCQKPIVCSVCGKMLLTLISLKSHMRSHSTLLYKCEKCPFTCKTPGAFKVHENKHLGIRPYQCGYCPKSFACGPVLQKHIRTHTGEKPYVCEICEKGFTGKHNLKVHMKVHGLHLVVSKKSVEEQSPPPESFSFY